MTIRPITEAERPMSSRRPAGGRVSCFVAGLFAVLALVVGGAFMLSATAHADHDKYYSWCTTSLGQTSDVCCTNAGGELFNGMCWDPLVLHPRVTAVPTITQQVLPPVVAPAP